MKPSGPISRISCIAVLRLCLCLWRRLGERALCGYEEQPEGFQDKYFEMLAAGGSKHHKDLLAPFGLDASDPAFWDKGLSMIAGFIDELKRC